MPLTGADRADGLAVLAGVRYELARRGGVEGVSIELVPIDESPGGRRDPGAASNALSSAAADSRLLGVVGPFLSASAFSDLSLASRSGLALVSPAVTSSCLDAPGSTGCPPLPVAAGRTPLLFRLLPSDDLEPLAAASVAMRDAGGGKVAVAWGGNPEDSSMAGAFSGDLEKRGGMAAPRQQLDPHAASAVSLFLKGAATGGDGGVFVAGSAAAGACLLRPAMDAAGFSSQSELIGGSALLDPACVRDAPAGGVVAVRPGPDGEHPPADSASAASLLKAAAGADYGRYSLPAAQAASLLLDAIGRALRSAGGNLPARSEVRAQLASSFDSLGGPRSRVFSVYALSSGAWSWRETVSV